MDFNIILAIFFLCLFSLFDIIIFNEEILLALCFLAFLFFCFNTLSDSVFSSFESRAAKFEEDLLFSFSNSKTSLIEDFDKSQKLQLFFNQFTVLLFCLTNFLFQCLSFLKFRPV
jgi:hypothetical protein